MRKFLVKWTALLALAGVGLAVETETWEHSSRQDFEKGTRKSLSLRSDGRMSLAPASKVLLDPALASLWGSAVDSRGNLYVGGGGPGSATAKLYRIPAAGAAGTLAELEGLQVQAVAVDAQDRVYAATSPDGKVYRIAADGTAEVFYDPGAKYIWAMAFNRSGELFVGTGDRGEIHRVTAAGQGSVFFRTEESHVRSMALDSAGNLIAGTEPSGLIVRIAPDGTGFVLYQSSKGEITSVAVAADGSVYAAGVGSKRPVAAPQQPQQATVTTTATATTPAPPGQPATVVSQPRPALPPTAGGPVVSGGSEVYRIGTDGHPRILWSDGSEVVYAIAFDASGRALFSTGNEGKIYRLDSDQLYTVLLMVAPDQVTALQPGPGGKLYALTGNVGQVFEIGPGLENEGTYESDVLDAEYFSYWGRLGFRGETAGGAIAAETRSGNLDRPQQNWSPWSAVPLNGDGRVAAPPARFLQYRLKLTAGAGSPSPEVSQVEAAYQQKNVAPVVDAVETSPPNYQFPQVTVMVPPGRNLVLPPMNAPRAQQTRQGPSGPAQSMQYLKGHQGVRWLSKDENGDNLVYTLEIRGSRETEWKVLEKDLKNQHLSWDTTAFPDGEYRLRVTASDRPSNPPPDVLTGGLESDPFLIDNTPPQIEDLTASRTGSQATLRWKAADALAVIAKAEYSVDGGEWTVVEPATRLSDSRRLDYVLELTGLAAGERTVAVRVSDQFENQGLAKVVVQ